MYIDKRQIIDEIEKHVEVFKRVNDQEYRIRCPICGDSQKNLRDAHMYIKCSKDPSEPLLYKCHKCNASGRVGPQLLEKLGISPKSEISKSLGNMKYNKLPSLIKGDMNVILGNPDMSSPQVRYISKRLGPGFTIDDFAKFKVIWDMNNIHQYITSPRISNTIPSNRDSVSFMSDDRSCILTRCFDDDCGRWRKIKIMNSSGGSFYTIKSQIDLFTDDEIYVNIAEGVFDVLSIYKNFAEHENHGRELDHHAYIAVLGSDYTSGVEYSIAKGLMGDNVNIRVFIDEGIDVNQLKRGLKRYRWLFRSISIFYNMIGKDVGVPLDQIKLNEIII